MSVARFYESTFEDGRVLQVGYVQEHDVYVIHGKNPKEGIEKVMVLSQEAMHELMLHYAKLLRYQVQLSPDGAGAELA